MPAQAVGVMFQNRTASDDREQELLIRDRDAYRGVYKISVKLPGRVEYAIESRLHAPGRLGSAVDETDVIPIHPTAGCREARFVAIEAGRKVQGKTKFGHWSPQKIYVKRDPDRQPAPICYESRSTSSPVEGRQARSSSRERQAR